MFTLEDLSALISILELPNTVASSKGLKFFRVLNLIRLQTTRNRRVENLEV